MACLCCQNAIKDALKGISLVSALGGLGTLLLGVHALVPLGTMAGDPSVAWFGWVLCVVGGMLVALGAAAATGSWCSLASPMHCFTGAAMALLPLQLLVVWAYAEHPSELRRLADKDQTYTLDAIITWVDAHRSVAAGLAAMWLLMQAAAVLLGAVFACCPSRRQDRHPWDRYWREDEESREALLPRGRSDAPAGPGAGASPRAAGYHTPPSQFASPYTSPARLPTTGPLFAAARSAAPSAPPLVAQPE